MRGKQDSGSFSQTGVVDSALAQAADDATRDAKQSAGKNSGSQPGQNQPDGQGGKNAAPQSNTSRRSQWFANRRRFFDSVNERVPLSVRLMSIVVIVLSIGTITITLSIRWLVTSYLIERADQQLIEQADLVFKNTRSLQNNANTQNGLTSYYVKIYNTKTKTSTVMLQPVFKDGVISSPQLPDDGSLNGHEIGVPFTTSAVVDTKSASSVPDHSTLQQAECPWRVVAFNVTQTDSGKVEDLGIVYIGISLSDQIDVINTLTKFCVMVSIAVVLLGGSIGALVVQRTLSPLKRIEKTAAKIAAGDLSQRVPSSGESTEIGSLAKSLNSMLAQIERSFREQQATTQKMRQFVSDASHELRTPLAAIHGYAELYKMQRDAPGALERADDAISHIEASSSRMTVLVEDLLSLARLDEGRGVAMNQRVDFTQVIQDSIDDLQVLDPERQITTMQLSVDAANTKHPELKETPGELPKIALNGDATRLHQVITNIVGNIHRYTPADSPVDIGLGAIESNVSAEQLAALPQDDNMMEALLKGARRNNSRTLNNMYAVAVLRDHGPGVPEKSLHSIFERFYTADPSRARQKGGTGLGLAIVLSIVSAHHGRIYASQTPEHGLTFTIILPMETGRE
ncbi:HAMP domain-containing sensor histidine kinase [Bifidobacterium canis]|uniref:histidine kinase n=1 Tax=Bifidobacterium canis TaxID=2610880 RepID=A0A7K1J503_9BIFI|nr:histidine kinase [Bifidobacterium canis]